MQKTRQRLAFLLIEVKLLRRRIKQGSEKEKCVITGKKKQYLKCLFFTLFCRENQDHMDYKESRVIKAFV